MADGCGSGTLYKAGLGNLFNVAVLLAAFAVLNLVIAGQPWGIVYGLGLWGANLERDAPLP